MMVNSTGDEHEEGFVADTEGSPEVVQEHEEELELADEEERLPWLESGEYDDEDTGGDNTRLIGFALLGLLAVALVVGLIWWLSNRKPDPELVADGSTIEAPEGDYKERPEDPGGRSFDGTGRTAAAVGEGETREGRVAEGSGSGNAASTAGSTGGTASETGGVGVQVGAYSTRERAVAGWNTLQRQTDSLNGAKYRVVEGQADIGKVFRLQAVASDASAANTLCAALKSDGVECQVKQ